MTTSSADFAARSEADEKQALIDEIAQLRLDLWAARDAAMGAIAEAGTLRARNVDLERTVAALRSELARLSRVEQSITYRVGASVLKPAKALRKLAN